MDPIVAAALKKWPNVPHCYGWLALDARGDWYMRDDRMQAAGPFPRIKGSRIEHEKLREFICRNYGRDDAGAWYFQNGPQRVYLNLEATPFIARTDPAQGLVLHTGEAVASLDRAFMTETGEVLVDAGGKIAQLDDRDVAHVMTTMEIKGAAASDEALMAWLESGKGELVLRYKGQAVPVERIERDCVPQRFGFTRLPAPPAKT